MMKNIFVCMACIAGLGVFEINAAKNPGQSDDGGTTAKLWSIKDLNLTADQNISLISGIAMNNLHTPSSDNCESKGGLNDSGKEWQHNDLQDGFGGMWKGSWNVYYTSSLATLDYTAPYGDRTLISAIQFRQSRVELPAKSQL